MRSGLSGEVRPLRGRWGARGGVDGMRVLGEQREDGIEKGFDLLSHVILQGKGGLPEGPI